jgi:muconolactone delta-isomerase
MTARVRIVSLEVTAAQTFAETPSLRGAYANVYVLTTSDDEAIAVALTELKKANWRAGPITSVVAHDEADLPEAALQYTRQCKVDGVVVVLHAWREPH